MQPPAKRHPRRFDSCLALHLHSSYSVTNIAETIVDRLLEGIGTPNVPVKLRLASGEVIDAVFNGYWPMFNPPRPSVGYPNPEGGHSHGIIHPGDEIVSQVPSPEEWGEMEKQRIEKANAEMLAARTATPTKATFWPTSGSGA